MKLIFIGFGVLECQVAFNGKFRSVAIPKIDIAVRLCWSIPLGVTVGKNIVTPAAVSCEKRVGIGVNCLPVVAYAGCAVIGNVNAK